MSSCPRCRSGAISSGPTRRPGGLDASREVWINTCACWLGYANGVERSTRRPVVFSIFSTRSRTWPSPEDRGGQLRGAATGDEHAARLVDPDLLDGRVVEVALQRTEAGNGVVHRPCRGVPIGERGQAGGERSFIVLGNDLVDEATHGGAVLDRVQTTAADELTNLRLDRVNRAHACNLCPLRTYRELPVDVWCRRTREARTQVGVVAAAGIVATPRPGVRPGLPARDVGRLPLTSTSSCRLSPTDSSAPPAPSCATPSPSTCTPTAPLRDDAGLDHVQIGAYRYAHRCRTYAPLQLAAAETRSDRASRRHAAGRRLQGWFGKVGVDDPPNARLGWWRWAASAGRRDRIAMSGCDPMDKRVLKARVTGGEDLWQSFCGQDEAEVR